MDSQTHPPSQERGISEIPWNLAIRFLLMTVFMLSVLFLAAGRLDWWEAWVYTINALVILIGSRVLMIRKNPDMARERAEAGRRENVKPWDKILMPLIAIILPLVSWIVAGLDKRFGWSPDLPNSIQIIALGMLSIGSIIGSWAMIVNRFFSSHVRIQTDRGHEVVDQGPYRIVRHPGYAGGLLSWIAAPIFFSSHWVAIPSILAIMISVLRTALEDRTLQEELPGYKEYSNRVRYRLLPGIW